MKFKDIFNEKFFSKMAKDNILELAASLSYYTALSLAPLLILLFSCLSYLDASLKQELISQVQSLVGPQAADIVTMIANGANNRSGMGHWAGGFGILTFLFSATAIFGQLRHSLNKIFEVKEKETPAHRSFVFQASLDFLRKNILNMAMVFTFAFISIASLIFSSFLAFSLNGTDYILGQVLQFIASLLIFTVLFTAIYFFLPQTKLPRKTALLSGFITSILFSIGKSVIGIYLGQSAMASFYGAAGSLIVLLMWVYYSSIIILVSAEISYRLSH